MGNLPEIKSILSYLILSKCSKIHLFPKNNRRNISQNLHRKGCAIRFSQLKKHVSHLKFLILLYRVNRKGADFANMSVGLCVSKSCQKS